MAAKGKHRAPKIKKLDLKHQRFQERVQANKDARAARGPPSQGSSSSKSPWRNKPCNTWEDGPRPERPAEPNDQPLNKGRSQATWGLSRTNRRPNVVDKLHMTLAEVTPVQAEEEHPSQIQSDIDDIERETSNLMAAARDEEEQDEESPTQRRRTRRGSNPPSAPSAKAGRTATTRERFKPLRTPTRCQCTVN